MCSAAACKNVLLIADTRAVDTEDARRSIQAGREEDRHHLHGPHDQRRVPDDPDRRRRTSRSPSGPGWGKDYADAADVLHARSSTAARSSRTATRTTRSSGITPAQCKKLEGHGQRATNVPSVDTRTRQVRRPDRRRRAPRCYEKLDKTLMTKVVPWVPYLWSNGDPHHEQRTSRSTSSTSSAPRPRTRTIAVK